MSTLSEHHKTLTNGVGKCSVPMWSMGTPGGFCDRPAFGNGPPPARTKRGPAGYDYRDDGLYPGYVPALACEIHGGPKLVTMKDGSAWMAALPGFTNIQECVTGWGDTEEAAKCELLKALSGEGA